MGGVCCDKQDNLKPETKFQQRVMKDEVVPGRKIKFERVDSDTKEDLVTEVKVAEPVLEK